jgi:hypothetical protein
MYSYVGSAPASIDFGAVAAREPDAAELVERKACEGGCGGWFYRPLPKSAREGEKICPGCRRKTLAEQALQAGLLAGELTRGSRRKPFCGEAA